MAKTTKTYHWIGLALLALCLGCDAEAPAERSEEPDTSTSRQQNTSTKPNLTETLTKVIPPPTPPTDMMAAKILTNMVKAYKNATSYTDQGQVICTFDETRRGNLKVPRQIINPYSMSLEKPNKIVLRANLGTVICDGQKLYEFIDAEVLRYQYLEKPAPEKITIASLYPDPLLADMMAQGWSQYYAWIPIQEILLLADNPLNTLLYGVDGVDGIELLEPSMIGDHTCYRVAIQRPDGRGIFWIDTKSFLLRRFEFPMKDIKRDFGQGPYKNHKVVAEFRDARFNTKLPRDTFSFKMPKNVHAVANLIPVPIRMLGKPAPDFFFDSPSGNPVTLKSLAGKTIVIHFWASWSKPSVRSLDSLNRVAKHFQGDDRIAFLACNTDQKSFRQGDLKRKFSNKNFSLPIYIDPQHFAEKGFHIPGIPVVVIIGPKGKIQSYLYARDIPKDFLLRQTINVIAEGKDFYRETLTTFDTTLKTCDAVNKRMIKEDLFLNAQSLSQMIPLAGIAEKSEPKRLRIISRWKNQNVSNAGNLLVVNDSGTPRILVCHDSRFLAELDTKGKTVKDYKFALPRNSVITNLRTAKTARGDRYYVGFAPDTRQCFLLDKAFQVKWSFPTSARQSPPGGIADVQIADLTGDGEPEIFVGYKGKAGVTAVSLGGKELWTNREVTGITKMAVVSPAKGQPGPPSQPGRLLCTSNKCLLFSLDAQGRIVKRLDNANRLFYWITAAQLIPDKISLCGLRAPENGKNDAMGLNLNGDLLWVYVLPDGFPGSTINRIITGQFFPLQAKQWVLLGADSSIHILSEEGALLDQFNYGTFAAGIATATIDGRETLLISSLRGVEAITLEPKRRE